MREIEVESLLSMVMKSDSVWVWGVFQSINILYYQGTKSGFGYIPRRPGPAFIINVISFGVVR